MDLAQSLAERNAARYEGNNPQTRYLEENSPVPVDGSYIVKNNIQDVPDSEELTEAELVDLESDRGQVWAAASRVIYDAMYDNVNALTIKKPESEQDFARFGIEFMGQFDHNISQMGYNVAKLQNVDDRTKAAMYHLQSEFGRLPMFSWNGVRRATKGIFTDPTTYAALGSVGLGFFGRAGVKQTTKEGFKGMLRKGIANPYTIAAIEGGAYGGLYDYFTQEVELEANMRDSIDRGRLATSTAIGSAAGPALVGAGELAAKGAQKAAPAIRDMFDEAGQAADQRIAERSQDTGTTLNVGVDPTPAVDAALSYAGRKARKSGQLVGAPPEIKSQKALDSLRRNLTGLAEEGEVGRFWYERSSRAILDALGGDKNEADKLAQAIGITSSATGVKGNFDFALQAYLQHKAGNPIQTGRFPKAMSARLQSVFDGNDWEGRKTNTFYVNLMREIDPSRVQDVTVDMWMMRAFGFKNADGSPYSGTPTDAQYTFVEDETKRIADQLGWEPQQVQAAIWVAEKGRSESGVEKAAFDFSNALLDNRGQISWEAQPGANTNHLPELFDAPYEVQQEYHVAISKAFLDDDGNDIIAKALGLPTPGDFEAPGFYKGKVSPGTQTEVAAPRQFGSKGAGQVEPSAIELMEAYSAARGILMKQEAVGFHRPFFNALKRDANGAELRIGRPFSEAETARLGKIMQELSGTSDLNPIGAQEGVRLINFAEGLSSADFTKMVKTAIERLELDDDVGVEIKLFQSQNGYISNDWGVNPNGEDYINGLRGGERSDLQRRVRDIVTQIQGRIDEIDIDFSDRYGFTRNESLNQQYR